MGALGANGKDKSQRNDEIISIAMKLKIKGYIGARTPFLLSNVFFKILYWSLDEPFWSS